MRPPTILAAGLMSASAFSALPSAFYGQIAAASGSAWSTALLFSGHGMASIVGMTATAIPAVARSAYARPAAAVALALSVEAAGGVLLVVSHADQLGGLLVGRLICGFALGAVTALVSRELAAGSDAGRVITAAIFGGVGMGSIIAGLGSAVGLSMAEVMGVGVAVLVGAIVMTRKTPRGHLERSAGPQRSAGPERSVRTARSESAGDTSLGLDAAPAQVGGVLTEQARGAVVLPALGAFASTAILAVFTSTVPAVLAGAAGANSLLAGTTAGVVMLAAGTTRILPMPMTGALSRVITVLLAIVGAVLFAIGMAVEQGAVALILSGTLLLGIASGRGYAVSLQAVAHPGAALLTVQRSGQFGLVVPTIVVTAVSTR